MSVSVVSNSTKVSTRGVQTDGCPHSCRTGILLPRITPLFASHLEIYTPTDERIVVGIKSLDSYTHTRAHMHARRHTPTHVCVYTCMHAHAHVTRYPDGPDLIQDKIINLGSALNLPLKLVKATGAFNGDLSLLVRFKAIVDIPYTTNTAMFAELYASAVPSVVRRPGGPFG